MKKFIKYPTTILGIVLLIVFIILVKNNTYTEEKSVNCIVLDKIQQNGGYKYPGHFYLVLREKENKHRLFDIIVNPATYSQAKIGQNITFRLSEMDIEPTFKGSLTEISLFFSIVISIGCFLASGLYYWFENS